MMSMPSSLIRPEAGMSPPAVKPLLSVLTRLQERQAWSPGQLQGRAQEVLEARFGVSEAPVASVFVHGPLGLMAEHTHYFDGFGLFWSLVRGTAVAARTTQTAPQVVFEGAAVGLAHDPAPEPSLHTRPWFSLVEDLLRRLTPRGIQVEVAVVSTLEATGLDTYLATLGIATAQALQHLLGLPHDEQALRAAVQASIATSLGRPFSMGWLLATAAPEPDRLLLTDAATREHILVETPLPEVPGWGLLEAVPKPGPDKTFFWTRKEQAEEALALLQKGPYPEVESLRDIEHRDLAAALERLPRRLQPTLRHLVGENGRVQKLVVAFHRQDWQLLGVHLLMSHGSKKTDWGSSCEEADFVVKQAENLSMDGVFGATLMAHSVLLVGRPFSLPPGLDQIQQAFVARFGRTPDAHLL
jgi:galactokinase